MQFFVFFAHTKILTVHVIPKHIFVERYLSNALNALHHISNCFPIV